MTIRQPGAEPAGNTTAYRLQGLLVLAEGDGWAVIGVGSEVGLFRPGDVLPGGESVKAVEAGGIVIAGPRGAMRIALEEATIVGGGRAGDPAPGSTAAASATDASSPRRAPSAATLQRARDLLNAVRVQRVRVASGEVGLRIAWISDDPTVVATGLRRGDIIMSINGYSVENPDAYAAVLAEAEEKPVVSIEVLRGVTRTSLTVEVADG